MDKGHSAEIPVGSYKTELKRRRKKTEKGKNITSMIK